MAKRPIATGPHTGPDLGATTDGVPTGAAVERSRAFPPAEKAVVKIARLLGIQIAREERARNTEQRPRPDKKKNT